MFYFETIFKRVRFRNRDIAKLAKFLDKNYLIFGIFNCIRAKHHSNIPNVTIRDAKKQHKNDVNYVRMDKDIRISIVDRDIAKHKKRNEGHSEN